MFDVAPFQAVAGKSGGGPPQSKTAVKIGGKINSFTKQKRRPVRAAVLNCCGN
jgi:hypothetical protein